MATLRRRPLGRNRLALVPPKVVVPPKSLVVGVPGKIVRQVRNEEYEMILERPQEYIDLATIYLSKNS